MKVEYLGDKAAGIPEKYWSQFICLGGASELQYQIGQFVPRDKHKVLIIGIQGGRDYFYFKAAGYDVHAFDLFDDDDFPNLQLGNIEEDGQLPSKTFDAVVFCGTVEHLTQDYKSLVNIKAALKDDGVLVVNTNYWGDLDLDHMHIYSPKTLRRLLRAAGFEVVGEAQGPSVIWFPVFTNTLHHALNALVFLISGKTLYRKTLPLFWKLNEWMAARNFFLRKHTNNRWMTTLKCLKTAEFNYLESNKVRFKNVEYGTFLK